MKLILVFFFSLGLLTSCNETPRNLSSNQSVTMNTAQAQEAIQATLFAYRDALNASSVDQVIPLYTPDGVFMPSNGPTAVGPDQLKGAYEFVFNTIQLSIEFFIDEIVVEGEVAFARTTSRGSTLIHATGETMPEENRELFVLEKVAGQWLIARYMFNKME